MCRDILGKVNIRISNELFVGYPNIKIPENTSFKLLFGENKDHNPIIVLIELGNENRGYVYEMNDDLKEFRESYWNLCIPYDIVIINNSPIPLLLSDTHIEIYITNQNK